MRFTILACDDEEIPKWSPACKELTGKLGDSILGEAMMRAGAALSSAMRIWKIRLTASQSRPPLRFSPCECGNGKAVKTIYTKEE